MQRRSGTVGEVAFRVARSPLAGWLVRAAFATAPALLPLSTVQRDDLAGLYEHPRPAYGTRHLLAVPHRAIPDLFALAHPANADHRAALWRLVDRAGPTLGCNEVLVNAGLRQDVGQVHLHLTDGPAEVGGSGRVTFGSWEEAVLALHTVDGIGRWRDAGFTLVSTGDGTVLPGELSGR